MSASYSLFDSRVGFLGKAIHSRDGGPKGRCHGNRFWDYTSCTWPVMGDNYMRFRINYD